MNEWLLLGASLLIVAVYEVYVRYRRRTRPLTIAQTAHAQIRANWARALRSKPGHEILAVQTIRNSVMASSITASTAVLAFVALASQVTPRGLNSTVADAIAPTVHGVVIALLLCILFGAFLLSAMSVRYFNHAGYMLATPASSGEQHALTENGALYVARAGHLYSMSLRAFLFAAPLVIGLLSPLLMLVASFGLIVMLMRFDRPPPAVPAETGAG